VRPRARLASVSGFLPNSVVGEVVYRARRFELIARVRIRPSCEHANYWNSEENEEKSGICLESAWKEYLVLLGI
jgi:hypothetical protein